MNLNFGTPSSQEFRAYARAEGQAATTADDVVVGTWSTSGERQAYLDRRPRVIVVALPAMALAVVGYAMIKPEDRSWVEWSGTGALVVAAILLTWCLMPYWASGRAYRQRKLATAAARVDKAVEDIAAAEELPLTFRMSADGGRYVVGGLSAEPLLPGASTHGPDPGG